MGDFYEKLYSSSNVRQEDIDSLLDTVRLEHVLNETQKLGLESEPRSLELLNAVNNIKENKSPGLDGIPIELYKTFWAILEKTYTLMIKESWDEGVLPFSTMTSVLSLIHKQGDTTKLSNYRPLSLSNTDYKIIACVFSERIQNVIGDLVNFDQTGYIKSRNICTSIRNVIDLYEYTEKYNIPGALICIDFEKAFDSVEHNFIFTVLKKFNFGDNFIKWMRLFYNNPCFKIKNNGWISKPYYMKRGIRQGCSMSALLFVLVVEILATMIRTDQNIKGLTIGKTEHKICQYADDATIFSSDLESIKVIISVIDIFSNIAGPKLNIGKTKGIWLGALKELGLRIYSGIQFTGNPVKCLGLYIGHNKEKCYKLNWVKKLVAIKNTISYW